ncbi:DUF5916 domain-containing protein [Candidatus Palauibacter soopunensis]|uniref:DUF5916 domain-containing protein n=1 Tax=Candidatus Palauibacter soopunensis TaxID=3056739 RepID=UPI0023A3E6AD|nr:DUF5916 domain-containing protein [Candidatus Palauibacter soopunensis]MDE2878978.1 DUF5916 domain-containing protein [Candidatus Palauibacter soopunensis]
MTEPGVARRVLPAVVAAILLLFPAAGAVGAQGLGPEVRQQLRATFDETGSLDLDGRLDDAAWAQAEFATTFWQREPDEGMPSTRRTEVAFVFDDEALWVGARMYTEDPDGIRAYLTRRDQDFNSEQLIVSIDSDYNHRTAFSFGVNAAGGRRDWFHYEDDIEDRDYSWEPVWGARVQRHAEGWNAELRIPLSQLRFDGDEPAWGVNVARYMPDIQEWALWELLQKAEPGWSSRFGDLTGVERAFGVRHTELIPYLAVDGHRDTEPHEDESGSPYDGFAGADLKIGLTSNLTLDVAVNPDFGQVEADPAVVNLTAFEEVFEERRPFFTEGRRLMEGLGPRYYYSRRLGAPPRGRFETDTEVAHDQTTILGAAKVTGRLPGGAWVGALFAVNDREEGHFHDPETHTEQDVAIEPRSGFGVARIEQQFGEWRVGLTGTAHVDEHDERLSELLTARAFAGGADWRYEWGEGEFETGGHIGFSHIGGDSLAILEAQMSSARWFQRPDVTTARLDPARTSLSGYTAGAGVEKVAGRWLWGLSGDVISPGFEINEVGQMFSADRVSTEAEVAIRETTPSDFAESWQVGVTAGNAWNFEGVRTETLLGAGAEVKWPSGLETGLELEYAPTALSVDLTRGGPLMETAAAWGASASLANDRSARTGLSLEGGYGRDDLDGWVYRLGGSITLRPSTRLELRLDPSYEREVESQQYVTTLADGRAATFGHRYVFGSIDRSTLAMQIRGSYAFTPDFTLEAYLEPFAAIGRYQGLGELLRPRGKDLLRYGEMGSSLRRATDGSYEVTEGGRAFSLPNADFNVLSFRSNVVLRWEWGDGSTLFLVWQQDRSDMRTSGELIDPGRVLDSFGAPGEHVFLVKVAYWLHL